MEQHCPEPASISHGTRVPAGGSTYFSSSLHLKLRNNVIRTYTLNWPIVFSSVFVTSIVHIDKIANFQIIHIIIFLYMLGTHEILALRLLS